MGMSINTNVAGLNAQRSLASSQGSLQTSMQRLSTGLRINSAKDDAAGSAIADRMNAQVKGMNAATRNANDGISMLQTVDGALGKITDSMQRMRELAVQAANGTNNTTEDYTNLDAEFQELALEINRVMDSTKFNGISVLNSSNSITFQVGANNDGGGGTTDTINVTMTDVKTDTAVATAIDTSTALTDQGTSQTAIDTLDTALDKINEVRSKFGAVQNRFESVVSTLQVASENQAAARGRIMDTDFAAETANLSRSQVLQQAGTAMLAQANQSSQNVMQLLR